VNIIGKVNVMASATLAYAGHAARKTKPAAVTAIIHTRKPAIALNAARATAVLPAEC
jgi:hypothetical protein